MKKFTISFLTAFFFCISVFSGSDDYAIRTGLSAAAFEAISAEEEFDADML